jgi:DinB superfamily
LKDPLFIEKMLLKGKEAGEKVKIEFTNLSLEQLNWKPSPESWGIGQCLDHLIVSDCSYFAALKKIASGKYKMTFWEKWNPFSILFGRILVNQLKEKVKKKLKAPKVLTPSASSDAGITDRFHTHLDTLLEYITACKTVNVDKTHITSPIFSFVTYSLRNAITILIQHEHRHINQAIKVKQDAAFPTTKLT